MQPSEINYGLCGEIQTKIRRNRRGFIFFFIALFILLLLDVAIIIYSFSQIKP